MKKAVFLLFIGTLMGALTGCSTPYHLLASQVMDNAQLNSYKTYSFVPYYQQGKMAEPGRLRFSESDYNGFINAIRTEMNKRGYTETSNGSLLIAVGLTVLRNATVNTNIYPAYGGIRYYSPAYFRYGWAPYWRHRTYRAYTTARIDKEGVLVMEMIDPKNESHLYTAAVSAVLDPSHTQLKDTTQLEQAARVLFKKFPVHSKK
ncbi:DUF4136 domain-containing protein [Microbacter margulisiae]|uniref:DUF4136 domain-containing protein n=1 Tax=Microbacter margulisiae TaxID=1350067 RepID=A0A7W5H1B6_9PORP|nr:DUF4136 domain-containing protein [Microbacter margulisiae]MBB3186182.1 hypothetical protein [Microbacter margulisiae]